MRCVIYTRVSTEDQTVENQISQLKEYAERQNWNVIDIVSDIASGGKSANERSGLPWQGRENSMFCYFGASTAFLVKALGKLWSI